MFASGERKTVAGSNEEGHIVFERSIDEDAVYVGLNVSEEERLLTLQVDSADAVVVDAYQGETYEASEEGIITLSIPSMSDGGTVLLTVEGGQLVTDESSDIPEDTFGFIINQGSMP
ncbi:type II secretory pathway, pullulanase PulA and related glycosidase [Geomicrobium sp. JCM 19037]|uniref:hypothetical protein n=1 Tax=Geomicrobium sp. JCM 19037 TaxID=1460634 RepID=UPI00045F3489|nr:hypothetical protein [Geomicrobium sp. JCM 19037]GAK02392.1 type II secretory pathway, pullulanase PulA and related glycosidase [Geomicrobium sp. JCM 19037]